MSKFQFLQLEFKQRYEPTHDPRRLAQSDPYALCGCMAIGH